MTPIETDLFVRIWGEGHLERAVLLHGSNVPDPEVTWQKQRPLADHITWESEISDLLTLIGERAHIVGHSYGGVLALLLGSSHPERVSRESRESEAILQMNLNPPPRDTVHALALQHFAFLLEQGFVLQPEEKAKSQRKRAEFVRYRRQQWEVALDLQYIDGWYTVTLVPLVDGKPRPGYPTGYSLLQYLGKYQGVEDEEVTSLAEHQRHTQALLSVEYADDILARYARILARYVEQIMAASPPPVERV